MVSVAKHNTPALRFHGFDGEWETSELNVLVEVGNGRDYKHLNEGRIPVYGTGGYMLSVDQALSYNKDAIGIGRKGTIDKPYLLRAPFWTVDTLFFVMAKSGIDLPFLFSVFQRVDWKSKNTATGVPSLTNQAIEQTTVTIAPSLKEQRAIGELFTDLDALIEQHRAKHANLQQTKTALMQRMFPQDGADEPELRLNGFSAAWDEVQIKNVSDVLVGNPFQSSSFVDDGIRLVRGTNVKRGWLDFDSSMTVFWPSIRGVETFLLDENDILLQMDGALIGKSFAMVAKTDLPALLVQRVARVRAHHNVDPKFLYQWFVKDFFGYIRSVKTETAVPHLSALDILSFRIKIPPTLEEQRAIGEVFSNLDALIAAEHLYITQLTQAKTALLQRMFV